jgi:hypothetical protein
VKKTILIISATFASSLFVGACALFSGMGGGSGGGGGGNRPAYCRNVEMSAAPASIASEMRTKSGHLFTALDNRCSSLCNNEAACVEGKEILRQYYTASLGTHLASPHAYPTLLEAITSSHITVDGVRERYAVTEFLPIANQISEARANEARSKLSTTGTFDRHTDGNECVFSKNAFASPENPNQDLAYVFRGAGTQVYYRCYSDRAFQTFPNRDGQELYLVIEAEGIRSGFAEDAYVQIDFRSLGDPRTLGKVKVADGVFTVPDSGRADAKAVVYRITLKNQYINAYQDVVQDGAVVRQPVYGKEQVAYSRFAWFR